MITDAQLRRLRPGPTQPSKVYDGDGLYVILQPNGRHWWRYDYRLGTRRSMSLGVFPDVGVAAARTALRTVRAHVAAGHDPIEAERVAEKRARVSAGWTFEALAREWLAHQAKVYEPRTHGRITRMLERHLLPELGPRPIAALDAADVLATLRTIERAGRHETAHRCKHYAGMVFRYAIADGRATRDPTGDLKGVLIPPSPVHFPALTNVARVGDLLRAIDLIEGSRTVRAALQLAPLLFVRPGELRTAEWSEIDLVDGLWRIPASKMKMRAEHLVPLATQSLALLGHARQASRGSRFVFPTVRSIARPLSDATLTVALRRLGFDGTEMTVHGFRAMARTLLDERLGFPAEWIEVQLAHAVPGLMGATYNRARYLEQRRGMMQAWADELDRLRVLTPDVVAAATFHQRAARHTAVVPA